MKGFVILILSSLLLGAIFTPMIYSGIVHFFPNMPWPYSRVFDRVLMVIIFILIILLKKEFSLKDTISKFKTDNKLNEVKKYIIAIFISLGVSVILVPFLDMSGVLEWNKKEFFSYYVPKTINALLAGIFISVLEEAFFRGILLDKLKKIFNLPLGIILSSICYACVHFLKPNKTFQYSSFSIASGFKYYQSLVDGMYFDGILYDLFGLFLVGAGLCLIMTKFSSIYINMGLHTGWVIAMKLFVYSTKEAPNVVLHEMKRRYFLLSEPLSWFSIILVFIITFIIFSKFHCKNKN